MDHQHDSKMMWVMMLACALPIIVVSFAGPGRTSSVIWIVIGLGAMLLVHWLAKRFMHQSSNTKEQEKHGDRTENQKSPDTNHHS